MSFLCKIFGHWKIINNFRNGRMIKCRICKRMLEYKTWKILNEELDKALKKSLEVFNASFFINGGFTE